ncbi:MAG: carboxypeptidase-like regulatory domain-containing protein [Candidatus Micrarchaeota archaeon]
MSTKIFALAILAIMLLGGFAFAQYGYDCYGYYGYLYSCNEDNDNPDKPNMQVTLESTCEGTVLTVYREGGDEVVKNAHFSVKNTAGDIIASGNVDDKGQYVFPPTRSYCGMDVVVKATHGEYSPLDYDWKHPISLVSCDQCGEGEPECSSNDDCLTNERCLDDGSCAPVQCADCQRAANHGCEGICTDNQVCQNNVCTTPQPGGSDGECAAPGCCMEDSACEETQYCAITAAAARGSCQPLPTCGKVEGGIVTNYECGDESGCPSCPQGNDCQAHVCYPIEVECQTDVAPGDDIVCTVSANGQPVGGYDVEVTNPDGSKTTYTSGADGTFTIPNPAPGSYSTNLGVNFMVGEPAPPPTTPSGNGGFNWGFVLLLLLLLGLLGLVVWLLSKGKLKF